MRALIVDDSRTARVGLRKLLERTGIAFDSVDVAADATEALRLVTATSPDLVTMDLVLGDSDGVDLCSQILEVASTRVVIVTGNSPENPELLFRALRAGAMDVLAKPTTDGGVEEDRFLRAIRALVSAPAPRRGASRRAPAPPPQGITLTKLPPHERLLLGVSTGGPPLLERILCAVPTPLAVPWVIVQHIASGFGEGFAQWLQRATGHPVAYVRASTTLHAGCVYVAPDDAHLRLSSPTTLSVVKPGPDGRITPSVDELFLSATRFDAGRTVAMLMTGMGADGAEGMAALLAAGAFTIAQEPTTCAVGSMPRAAIDRGAACAVLTADAFVNLVRAGR